MQGTAVYRYPRPWVLVAKISGHLSADMVDDYLTAINYVVDRGRVFYGFHDWSGMPGYDSICRKRFTEWALQHRPKTGGHHILVVSKLVAMGVSTASMLLGGNLITSYTDRAEFERALADVCLK